jgi:hypothetical protein
MSAIRSLLASLGLSMTTPCAKSEEPPATAPMVAGEQENPDEVHRQYRAEIHKNRNLHQISVQLARRSTREWNNAERMAAAAIAEIQRKREDQDQ